MLLFVFLLLLVYCVVVGMFVEGWRKMVTFQSDAHIPEFNSVALVVVCKNEEINLPVLLDSLQHQTFNTFHLILVNDHSSDHTAQIAQCASSAFPSFTYVESTSQGKKASLLEAIGLISEELVITTDADCIPSPLWLETMVNYYLEHKSDLIICPMKFTSDGSNWQNLQQVEFLSLAASTGGAAGMGMPIMCNGANLAAKRELWVEAQSYLKDDIASGDDMFLLQRAKQTNKKIDFLKSTNAIVSTQPNNTIYEFMMQRSRWAGKSKSYTDVFTIFVALLVFGVAFSQFILMIASFASFSILKFCILFFIIKLFFDNLLLFSIADFFEIRKGNLFVFSILLSLIYPFYIINTVLLSIFRSQRKW